MMIICWFALSVVFLILMEIPKEPGNRNQGLDVMFMFVLVARGFALVLFTILMIYMSEYYPTVIRSTAVGFGYSLSRIGGMITMFVAEDLEIAKAMFIYSVVSFISLLITIMLPQDTTGLILKDQIGECVGEMIISRDSATVNQEKKGGTIGPLRMKQKLEQGKKKTLEPLKK